VRVYTFERLARRRRSLTGVRKSVEEDGEALLGFGVSEGGVKACERGVRYDVDSAATRSARAFSPSFRTKVDASAHFGV
jgi:hypothetical protein